VEDPPIYKGYVLIFLGCLVGVVVAVGTISAVMTCRSRGKRQHHLHHSLEDDEMGGGQKDQNCFKNNVLRTTASVEDAVNIKAVRQIFNDKMPAVPVRLNEEVHMRLLESSSGSSTEASTADNSRASSASHSRNSSTGSNVVPPPGAAAAVSEMPNTSSNTTIPEVSSSSALLDHHRGGSDAVA